MPMFGVRLRGSCVEWQNFILSKMPSVPSCFRYPKLMLLTKHGSKENELAVVVRIDSIHFHEVVFQRIWEILGI